MRNREMRKENTNVEYRMLNIKCRSEERVTGLTF